MADEITTKRIIEMDASSEVLNNDWLVKDSPTGDTTKILATLFRDWILAGVDMSTVADTWVGNTDYPDKSIVIYDHTMYQNQSGSTINTATFNPNDWTEVVLADLVSELENDKADKDSLSDVATSGDYDDLTNKPTIPSSAEDISYDNTTSELDADNVQDAIDEVLNKAGKIDDVQVKELEDYESVVDEEDKIAKIDLSALTVLGTASGEIASFNDGADKPMPALKVGIEPQQDLHGYDAPWAGGAGKNKLPLTVDRIKANNTNGTWNGNVYTESGVTFTLETNEGGNITGIKVNGTASANVYFMLSQNELNYITFDGSYVISGCSNGSSTTYALQVYSNESSGVRIDNFNEGNYIQSSNSSYTVKSVIIVIRSGYTANNLMFYPMIRLTSVTDATFAPYSNICPISGHTEANVTRCGKNLFEHNSIAVYTYDFVSNSAFEQMLNPFFMKGGHTYVLTIDSGNKLFRMRAFDKNHNVITNMNKINAVNHGTSTGLTYYSSGKFYGYNGTGADNITVFRPTEDMWFDSTVQTTSPTEIMLEVGDTQSTYEPYAGTTYNIQFKDGDNPLTVYGGSLDVTSGELVVDEIFGEFDGVDENWGNTGAGSVGNRSNALLNAFPSTDIDTNFVTICNTYEGRSYDNRTFNRSNVVWVNPNGSLTVITDSDIDTAEKFKALLQNTPLQVIAKLATPITYQLTPTQVKSLLGQNNIWADTGDVIEAKYVRDLNTTINDLIARVEALEG